MSKATDAICKVVCSASIIGFFSGLAGATATGIKMSKSERHF